MSRRVDRPYLGRVLLWVLLPVQRHGHKLDLNWVPEGSLAGNFRIGFRPIFRQTWPQDPSRSTGLVLQCRLHQKSARQTNSKAIPWRQKKNGQTACSYPAMY